MTEYIKVNFPLTAESFAAGDGEGMWVLVDRETKAAHDADETGGVYTGILDNDSIYYPGLNAGAVVQFEMRGENRPVAIFEGFLEELNRLTPAEKEEFIRKLVEAQGGEDCFGVLTKDVMSLCEAGDEDSLTRALALLCAAKKNRDADYFVCNLMIPTPRGQYSKEELARALHRSIRKMDVEAAGLQSMALFKMNRKELWKVLLEATKVYYPRLEDEVEALRVANDKVSKPSEETIFAAKAIVLIWTYCKRDTADMVLAHPILNFSGVVDPADIIIPKPLEECERLTGLFPDWAYNWHTYHGKYDLRRDAVHAITNDQRLLTPLEVNLFDDCSWNRDINACLEKWNPNRHRIPYDDGKVQPEVKYGRPGEKE